MDWTTCGHFDTQEDAQAALDSGTLPRPEFLDGDGDGIACEDAFGSSGSSPAGTVTLPSTGSGAATAGTPSSLAAGLGVLAAIVFSMAWAARLREEHNRFARFLR
ncbi:MAG: excalibur calcium-binding domain-containing protein [Thermomicrobiales bacterium]